MSEIRIKSQGAIKLFESDNTSHVTIASPASLSANRTITIPDADVTLGAGVSLTGSTNNQVTTVTGANAIVGEANLTFDGSSLAIKGTTPTLTIGDAGAEDAKIVFDGNAQDYHIGLDDTTDDLVIGKGSVLGTTAHIVTDENGNVTKPLQPCFLANVSSDSVHPNLPTGVTVINFGSEAYDVGNNVSSVGVFTAPVTGKYQFNTSMAFAQITSSTTLLEVFIKASNREMRGCLQNVANLQAGDYQSFGFSTMVDMDANDTCFVQVAITGGGGTIDVISGSTPAPLSFFSGTLIC